MLRSYGSISVPSKAKQPPDWEQHIVALGHHVTIDPAGLISTPVKLSDEKLNVLVDRVSHHKSALDNDVPESSREKDEGEHEEDD